MKIARFLAAALASFSLAQPAPAASETPDADAATVVRLEREMWDAWQRHDFAAVKRRTAPDYVCATETDYYPWSVIEKGFDDYKLESFSLGKIESLRVSPDVFVLSYTADIKGAVKTQDVSRRASEASIWVRRNGQWLALYLHEITMK